MTPVLANLISHTFMRPVGKIKIQNVYLFDIHWFIGRRGTPWLRLTSLNIMTSLNVMVFITIWRKSATPLSEMKGMQEKESSWVLGTDRKIRPSGITV